MKINVGVIFGGESVEHEVSIISAVQGMRFLDKDKYQVVPIYITKDRRLFSDERLMNIDAYVDLQQLEKQVPQVVLYKMNQQVYLKPIKAKLFGKTKEVKLDLIIPIIHGTNGEDGTVQGYLELLDIPYSGCDVIAAGVGQDKVVMKHVLAGNQLPIVPWTWFYYHDYQQNASHYLAAIEQIGYPVIVKPACLGSSVGINVAKDQPSLISAIEEAGTFDFKIVVEKMIEHLTEVNCSVLGDVFDCQASVLEQVGANNEFLTYDDKYQGNGKSKGMASTARIIPAPIDENLTQKIQALAIKTFKVLGAGGVSRIDFLIDNQTKTPYVNEINTIPGSLAFYLWQASGVSYPELLDRLVQQAIDRQRRKDKLTYSYDTNILANYKQTGSKGSKVGLKQ